MFIRGSVMLMGFVTSWLLLAQENTPFDWANLSALGILAFVVVWMVTRILPDHATKSNEQSKIFTESIERMQRNFTETLDKIHNREEMWDKRRQESWEKVAEELSALRLNCAVRLQKEIPKGC